MHQGRLYKAKVIAVGGGKHPRNRQYLVHFVGWKSRWDTWVSASLMVAEPEGAEAARAVVVGTRFVKAFGDHGTYEGQVTQIVGPLCGVMYSDGY